MARYLPSEQLKHLMWQSGEPIPPRLPPSPRGGSALPNDVQYILMDRTKTYALGVHALQEACNADVASPHPKYVLADGSSVYRPLTFKEGIVARLTDFNTLKNPDGSDRSLDERVKLFLRWNDSCTGAAYQAKSTKFKIIPVCESLILIDKDHNSHFLAVPYDSFIDIELDSSLDIYGSPLTKEQIEDHEGWRAAVEDDVSLLKNYRDAVFEAKQLRSSDKKMPEKAMGFYVRQNTAADELWALFVGSLGGGSDAGGDYYLSYGGSFVRVAPSQNFFEK